MNFETLITKREKNVLLIQFNRPEKLNALSEQVFDELAVLLDEIEKDRSLRGVILTGQGKAYAAGADIGAMSEMSVDEGENFSDKAQKITERFENLKQPVIAAVNGFALGGGCELAMCADFIYATENAKFGQPEVNLGLIPGFGGCVRLQKFVGPAQARELIYSGKLIDASAAEKIGLVNRVFRTQEEMLTASKETVELIAQRSPHAVALCKEVMKDLGTLNTREALEREKAAFRRAFSSPEKKEGVSAFLEKRAPAF